MANIDELLEQASEIRDANEEKENTALRVGTMLVNILQYIAGFIDRETLRQILQEYASLSGTGLVNWRQSRCVFLATMGTELDNIDGGKWEYTSHDGDIVFNPSSRTLRIAGEMGSYFPAPGVIYVNAHTAHLYKWDVSTQKMTELVDSSSPTVIDYRNAPAFADIPIGATYYFLSQSSGYKIGVKVDVNDYCSFAIDPKKVYAFRDTRQTAVWNADTQTWTPVSGRVINDLTTGGEGDALSAEQGKVLKGLIDNIGTGGFSVVDEHDNNSALLAPSARQMKLMYNNFMALYNSLANIAFINGKPTLDWVGSKTKYTLAYGTLNGCTADVAAGQVNEGALRIKLTPTQASYAFTSVTVNGQSVQTTATGDADGSVYLDIVVNGNITVAATAISGRAVNFNGGDGATIGAAGVAIGQDLDTTIIANEHFTLPASITVKIGNTNVTHTYTRAQDNKTATLHIDAANITGDLTITCTAVEDAHVTLAISGSNFVVKQGNTQLSNGSKVYNGSAAQTLTIEPASGYKFSTLPSADKGTMTNNGYYEASSLVIGTSVSGTLTITAAAAALDTFSIDLTVTSDVGVTWTNPSAAAQTILEGSPFKITLAKVSGTGVLQIGTCAMNGGTLTPNNGVIETAHVTGNITIAASVAAAPMKVHSYDFTAIQNTAGRNDGKPRYIEDDVAGRFRLYSVNNITQNSEATEDDPAWTAPGWTPSSGSYKGTWANGISNNYRAGYGNRVLDLEAGSDFTIILKGYSLYSPNNNVYYSTAQIQALFHDRASVGIGNQLVDQQFCIMCSLVGSSYSTQEMYPCIECNGAGTVSLKGTDAIVPTKPVAGDVYDVVYSYVAQTGLMSAFVVKRGSSSEVLVGGTMTKTGLAITCMQVYGYGSSVPTHLKGIELYNYAMDKTALETLYGITSSD